MSNTKFGTADDYYRAFAAIQKKGIPEKHIALLQAHFQAPRHTATWAQLASVVGFANGDAVNLQYGKLAGRVARLLGVVEPPKGFWLYVLAEWAKKKDPSGHTAFVMRRPVIEALSRLGVLPVKPLGATQKGAPLMRYWVVRAKPAWNDPFENWIIPNSVGRWQTKRPPHTWEKGDRVFVWASSPRQEIVGLSELYALPAKPDREGRYWFRLNYLSGVLQKPIVRKVLSDNQILRKSILLKNGPSFSVVRLTDNEGEELYRLVAQRNPETNNIWPELLIRNATTTTAPIAIDIDLEGKEGSKALRTHVQIERDPRLVKAKKISVLAETGHLECEVCGFDFSKMYGVSGKGFCEVHHLLPLSHRGRRITTLRDLAVVCSNCHRIIHRGRKLLSLRELRRQVTSTAKLGTPGGAKKRCP